MSTKRKAEQVPVPSKAKFIKFRVLLRCGTWEAFEGQSHSPPIDGFITIYGDGKQTVAMIAVAEVAFIEMIPHY